MDGSTSGLGSNGGFAAVTQTLVYGMKSFQVAELQEKLARLGFRNKDGRPLVADGVFGDHTLYAVRQFQLQANIDVTGEVDAPTWQAILAHLEQARATGPAGATALAPQTSIVQAVQRGPAGLLDFFRQAPLWQKGLLAMGAIAIVYTVYSLVTDGDGLLSGHSNKCPRVPSADKLVDAEKLEPEA